MQLATMRYAATGNEVTESKKHVGMYVYIWGEGGQFGNV